MDTAGNINLSPFSFFNVFSANPPVMVFSPSRRGRDNTTKDTYENVLKVEEVVINTVTADIVDQVSLASSEYPKDVNEFLKSGLTPIPSDRVKPPRVAESPVAFECRVNQVLSMGTEGGAGNLVIAEVLLIHLDPKYLDSDGRLQTDQLNLVGRMGGNWYVKASGEALFQVSKPSRTLGIGVDNLPDSIKQSSVLTGRDLASLAALDQLPEPELIDLWKTNSSIQALMNHPEAINQFHVLAKEFIKSNDLESAIKTLLLADRLLTE